MFQPISNKEISKTFELVSKVMELTGENEFKVKSYSIAAFKINKISNQLYTMTGEEIMQLEELSKGVKPKVLEILTTGRLTYLDELMQQVPAGLLELLQIKGLGAKKIKVLHDELDINSLGELMYACQENRLINLKGFGAKTQAAIIRNISFIQSNKDKYLYAEADNMLDWLTALITSRFPGSTVIPAGDFVRQLPVVTVLHLFSDISFEAVTSMLLETIESPEALLVDGTSHTFKLSNMPSIVWHDWDMDAGIMMLELNTAPDVLASWKHTLTDVKGKDEKEIFINNALKFIPPPQRETITPTSEMKTSLASFDIKGLIHCHSTWSDGSHSIEEMALAAISRGMSYMVISDHSVSAFYANGLTPERILLQHQEIDILNQKLFPFKIFKGIEADILYNGSIDYGEEIWPLFDCIIASVHSQLTMTKEKATERLLTALANPFVRILGHPTGRLLLSREGYPIDYDAVFSQCAKQNIAVEINAHPRRLDLDYTLINKALSYGLKLSINSDAHSIDGIDVLKYGIKTVQKTQMTQRDNLSSYTLPEFESFIKRSSQT